MLQTVRHLLEMIRFSHTLFALPFALLAAVMAWTTPAMHTQFVMSQAPSGERKCEMVTALGDAPPFRWEHLVGILICMVGARSAAMAFNRLADRTIDAANPRTQSRHIPAGTLSAASVALFTLGSSALFVAGTLLFLPNWLPLALAVPVLLFLLGYSYTKRFTSLAHFWLGAALMLAPICAWIAIRGQVLLAHPADLIPAILLGGAVLAWVAGFDIIYACQDADFDRQAKLRSVPATLGIPGALRLAAVCHLATLVLLAALPWLCPQVSFGWIYGLGIAAVTVLLVYEHSLVRADDLTRVNAAFFNVNVIISIGLLVVGAVDLLL
jgi:4-hydroxybenzoate polyprenyltransferase